MSSSAIEGRGSGIAAECVQELLESGKNSADKGQSQWETPLEFAKLCAKPLPIDRRTIVDLCAGHGRLALGASNGTTEMLLLNDIEACKTTYEKGWANPKNLRISGDIGAVFPLIKEIDARFDLFALNPFWDVHIFRKNLSKLAESDLETVRRAFEVTEPRCGKDAIDSTVALMMMSLDMMSNRGEGVLLANNSTMERLIFGDGAPYRLLENHVWARIVLKGNPMSGERKKTHDPEDDFELCVIYYAQSHEQGLGRGAVHRCERILKDSPESTDLSFEEAVENLAFARSRLRAGVAVSGKYHFTEGQDELFKGIRNEWEIRNGKRTVDFNIWIAEDTTIHTYLSVFDAHNTIKIPKQEAKSLFELNGKKPMQLVMARETRALLLHHCNGSIWRVQPQLKEAVEAAVAAYHAVRAPLMPLGDIQSLAYLDESDEIECRMDVYEDDLIPKEKVDISKPIFRCEEMNEEQSSTSIRTPKPRHKKAYFIRRIEEATPEDGLSEEVKMAIKEGKTVAIRLAGNQGGIALIDADDYEKCLPFNWRSRAGYALATMPRAEHKNRIRGDNRKENLRHATAQQNLFNSSKRKQAAITSKFKGVARGKKDFGWQTVLTINQRVIYGGLFKEEEKAAQAYDVMALSNFGDFANLNFPELRESYKNGTITLHSLRSLPPVHCLFCNVEFKPVNRRHKLCKSKICLSNRIKHRYSERVKGISSAPKPSA